jgi:hypothetical protein
MFVAVGYTQVNDWMEEVDYVDMIYHAFWSADICHMWTKLDVRAKYNFF